jgi:hypothetical protein
VWRMIGKIMRPIIRKQQPKHSQHSQRQVSVQTTSVTAVDDGPAPPNGGVSGLLTGGASTSLHVATLKQSMVCYEHNL